MVHYNQGGTENLFKPVGTPRNQEVCSDTTQFWHCLWYLSIVLQGMLEAPLCSRPSSNAIHKCRRGQCQGPSLHIAAASSPELPAGQVRNSSFPPCRDFHYLRWNSSPRLLPREEKFLAGCWLRHPVVITRSQPFKRNWSVWSTLLIGGFVGLTQGWISPSGGLGGVNHIPCITHRHCTLSSGKSDVKEAKQSVLCLVYLAKNYALSKNTVEAEWERCTRQSVLLRLWDKGRQN